MSERIYRVLLVHNFYKLAGGEDTLAVNEARTLREHGHTVVDFFMDNHDIDNFTTIQKVLTPFRLIHSRKIYRELKEIIEREKIEIIHAINIVPLIGFTLYEVAHDLNIPIIQAVNNFRYVCAGGACMRDGHICEECIKNNSYSSAVKYGCYRGSKAQTICLVEALRVHRRKGTFDYVDKYVVPSAFNKRKLESLIKDKSKIIVRRPSIPDSCTSITPATEREYYVYCARLERLKGIQIAIPAFDGLDVKLVVLGTGEEEQEMKDYVQAHGMKNVEFLGFKKTAEMQELFSKAKALIYPTQWYEGIPLTILEAYAQGTPIIGSNMGNVGDCIEDGYSGFTFQYDSPQALRETILRFERIASTDGIYKQAREVYERLYTEKADYDGLMRVFDECIKNH